jgi:ABC-type multidrug transport system permease subunit
VNDKYTEITESAEASERTGDARSRVRREHSAAGAAVTSAARVDRTGADAENNRTAGDDDQPHHQLVELTLVRLREFLREPEALFWSFLFPIIMTCALGVAFSSQSGGRFIVGVARVAGSERVTTALQRDARFTIRSIEPADVDRTVRDGSAAVVVVPGEPMVYRYDEARDESQAARLAVDAALQQAAGRVDRFTPLERPVTAVGSRYIDWVIPGLLGMGIMSTGMWSVGFSIATARHRKLLRRFVATPMVRAYYLGSFVLSRFVFLAIETLVLMGFAWLAFGVVVQGSPAALAIVCVIGALTFGAIALLVASRARTIEAVSGLLNFVMLPMWLLSGVFFASSNFPDYLQPAIQALPLTALIDALRAITNDGDPLARIAHELAILTAWGITAFALALKLFRWR